MADLPRLTLRDVGPIREANLEFGDLTVFVGAQATGKSIAAQMLAYAVDRQRIVQEMALYGLDWSADALTFWDLYLGEGMRSAIEGSKATWADVGGKQADVPTRLARPRAPKPLLDADRLFYIPAQRVLTMRDGWPKPFSGYALGDPYVVKAFSERTRTLLDEGRWAVEDKPLFPQTGRLKGALRDAVRDSIFGDFELAVDASTLQRRLVLRRGGTDLPYMVWSAGQREFVPLLVGAYWLLPPTKVSRRASVEWVVLEEPETGLHPRAVLATMLLVLEMMDRGYRVVLTTHSGQVLDVVWALREMAQSTPDARRLIEAMGARPTPLLQKVVQSAFEKQTRTYFFEQDGLVRDISALDPGSERTEEAGWGGLSGFSGSIADAVGDAIARSDQA